MRSKLFLLILTGIFVASCHPKTIPKPYGYFRISFPEKHYSRWGDDYPYSFEIPSYSAMVKDAGKNAEPYWVNLMMPGNKAQVHISYKKLNNDLSVFTEESRRLAYDHTIRASSIEEQIFLNPTRRVFGTVYHINGNAASPVQFYLTDSLHHFLRGALYISATPNVDSLKPVIEFLKADVTKLIETTEWRDYKKN